MNPDPPAACGGRLVTRRGGHRGDPRRRSRRPRPTARSRASALIHVYTLSGVDADGSAWLTLLYEFGGLGARARRRRRPTPPARSSSAAARSSPRSSRSRRSTRSSCARRGSLPDSGGPGTWRGGLGVETRDRAARRRRGSPCAATAWDVPAARCAGRRRPGAAGSFSVERGDGRVEQLAARQADVHARRRRRASCCAPPAAAASGPRACVAIPRSVRRTTSRDRPRSASVGRATRDVRASTAREPAR